MLPCRRRSASARHRGRPAAQGALDDDSFARFWQDNRNTFSPRSRALLRHELQRKGVPPELIETALAEVDDDDAAYRAARPRAARYAAADETEFRNRLGAYLKRRGFSYEVMEHTLERLWRERED